MDFLFDVPVSKYGLPSFDKYLVTMFCHPSTYGTNTLFTKYSASAFDGELLGPPANYKIKSTLLLALLSRMHKLSQRGVKIKQTLLMSFLLFAPLQRFDFLFMIKTLGNERCCSESNINRPFLASWKTLFFVELSNIVKYDLRAVHFDKRGVITLQQ